MAFILWIFNLIAIILAVVAGLRANSGQHFRYPFAIPFIR
jgi:uncharacterized Tic20 family protein